MLCYACGQYECIWTKTGHEEKKVTAVHMCVGVRLGVILKHLKKYFPYWNTLMFNN